MAVLGVFVVGALVLVALGSPGLVRFWRFTPAEFVQLVTPPVLMALLIERALEVFLTSWRGAEAARLALRAADGPSDLAGYKARTQRIAFLAGTTLGVIVAALGVRVLELLMDPVRFAALPATQPTLFHVADVLLTGAILGGGADGLHKLVSVFTNFMEATAGRAKTGGFGQSV